MKISRKQGIAILVSIIVLIGVCFTVRYLKSVNSYKEAVDNMSINEVDLSKVQDGVYTGECNVEFIYAKVEVTVEKGKIASINILEHRNERGKPAEKVVDEIVEQQKVNVDVVSGATNSSVVLEKAVENALEKGLK